MVVPFKYTKMTKYLCDEVAASMTEKAVQAVVATKVHEYPVKEPKAAVPT